MENQTFSFRAFLLACAALAGLVGAASLVSEDTAPPQGPPIPRLAASQAAAPVSLPLPFPTARDGGDGEREPDAPPAFELDEPVDGSGS